MKSVQKRRSKPFRCCFPLPHLSVETVVTLPPHLSPPQFIERRTLKRMRIRNDNVSKLGGVTRRAKHTRPALQAQRWPTDSSACYDTVSNNSENEAR